MVPLEANKEREGESVEAADVASAIAAGGIVAKLEEEGGEMDETEDAKSIEVRGEAVDMDEVVVGGSSSSSCGLSDAMSAAGPCGEIRLRRVGRHESGNNNLAGETIERY